MFAQIHAEIETIEVRKAFTWNHNPNLQKEIIAEINETCHNRAIVNKGLKKLTLKQKALSNKQHSQLKGLTLLWTLGLLNSCAITENLQGWYVGEKISNSHLVVVVEISNLRPSSTNSLTNRADALYWAEAKIQLKDFFQNGRRGA